MRKNNYIDETNNKYGYLTVIKPIKINNKIYWICKCKCGKEISVIGADLRRGHTTSCGCKQNRNLDLTGRRFGRLIVLNKVEGKKYFSNFLWHCKCDCGNECNIPTSSLVQDKTHSCGCLQKETVSNANKKSLIGKKFGLLTVLEEIPERDKSKQILYKCKCDCGNIKNFIGRNLSNGSTMSCGCLNMSHGELKIMNLLKDNNINFIQEYHPKTFQYFQNARYDFYIPQLNTLIEYDGKQHYIEAHAGWKSESLEHIQERDNYKNKWAIDNKFILIRIPYTHYDDLCIEDLLPNTSKFIIK